MISMLIARSQDMGCEGETGSQDDCRLGYTSLGKEAIILLVMLV
jgi:hypothetical protein